MYPRRFGFMPLLLAASALAGCGGGDAPVEQKDPVRMRTVAGPGFTFAAPQGRKIARTPRSVTVLPEDEDSEELESVTVFRLVKPYRPALWPQAAKELDGVARRLADSLAGELASPPRTVRRGGLRGRLYEIDYAREGVELRQRLTLLLGRRTEYQLLCRWAAPASRPQACADLEATFAVRSAS